MNFIVTGGAGFIGSHLTDKLLDEHMSVVAIDNFDPFYSLSIKKNNIQGHLRDKKYFFAEADILEPEKVYNSIISRGEKYDAVIHLAAKAGVRSSIEDPVSYEKVNVMGTLQMLELSRKLGIKKFIFASSSSVYGENRNVPWKESELDLQPASPYASSKISAEAYGRMYSSLYGLNFIALRFFTVYGPRQRPDLAIHKFFKGIVEGKPLPMYGSGDTQRDYTYIDDIISGIMGAIRLPFKHACFDIYNLGNSHTVKLRELIGLIEQIVGRKAILDHLGEQKGDVPITYSDITKSTKDLGFKPAVDIKEGLQRFYEWYKTIL